MITYKLLEVYLLENNIKTIKSEEKENFSKRKPKN